MAMGIAAAIPFLLITLMWHTITAPARWIRDFFTSDEIAIIEELRREHGFPGLTLEAGLIDGFYDPFPGVDWIVTSPFGWRIHPISGRESFHLGVDISWGGAYGTPIGAVASGRVLHSGFHHSAGNWVIIYHGDIGEYTGVITVYMHNTSNAVSTGDIVDAGDVIGFLGSTGDSTGPHLHLEIRINGFAGFTDAGHVSGTAVDPILFIGLPGMRGIEEEDEPLPPLLPTQQNPIPS